MKALLRLYPGRWQQRYRAEMEALLEELPRTPRVAVDLMKGALLAHLDAEPTPAGGVSSGGSTSTERPAPGVPHGPPMLTLRVLISLPLFLVSGALLMLAAAQTALIIEGFWRFGEVRAFFAMSERALVYAIPGLALGATALIAFRRR
jgi:hypothetical protein